MASPLQDKCSSTSLIFKGKTICVLIGLLTLVFAPIVLLGGIWCRIVFGITFTTIDIMFPFIALVKYDICVIMMHYFFLQFGFILLGFQSKVFNVRILFILVLLDFGV